MMMIDFAQWYDLRNNEMQDLGAVLAVNYYRPKSILEVDAPRGEKSSNSCVRIFFVAK
jgi:hypothetical protein